MIDTKIVLIDDDKDDMDMLCDAIESLNIQKEVVTFDKSADALLYLQASGDVPLLILCDVNMPLMNGFELRSRIYCDDKLKLKLVPFLFLSTSYQPVDILKAYELSVQGYFKKPATFVELKELVHTIISYWDKSYRPVSKQHQ